MNSFYWPLLTFTFFFHLLNTIAPSKYQRLAMEAEDAELESDEEDGEDMEEREQRTNCGGPGIDRNDNNNNFFNFFANFWHFRHSVKIFVTLLLLIPLLLFFVFRQNSSRNYDENALAKSFKTPILPNQGWRTLRVMSFNIWMSGRNVENGLEKIAKQIQAADPDIVALQEVQTADVAKNLTILLGPKVWKCTYDLMAKRPDTVIITKHKFVLDKGFVHLKFIRNLSDFLFHEDQYVNKSSVNFAMGATIQLNTPNGQLVSFYSLHLEYRSSGTYAAYNKLVTNIDQIMAGERNKWGYGRVQNIEQLLANEAFKKQIEIVNKQPLIVAGDFNTPSHLDWIEANKYLHGGWAVEWPATKLLMDAGFEDSFRKIHPDTISEPGYTWSTIKKRVGPEWDWQIPEPQERIDFIYYMPNAAIIPLNSFTFAGNSSAQIQFVPNHSKNEWPSDHFAIISEFKIAKLLKDEEE